jgi:hypothetical protein
MDAKQYGSRPAFPHAAMTEQVTVPTQHPGLTVREIYIGFALQGLLAADHNQLVSTDAFDATHELAIKHADRLVARLAKDGAP